MGPVIDFAKGCTIAPAAELLPRTIDPETALGAHGPGALLRLSPRVESIAQRPPFCFDNEYQPQYTSDLCEQPLLVKKLLLPLVNNATLLGNGIVMTEGGVIVSESVGRHGRRLGIEEGAGGTVHLSGSLRRSIQGAINGRTTYHDRSAIVLFDPAVHRFGMWLLKCLPKLSVLEILGDTEISVVVSTSVPDLYVALMKDLGMTDDRIVFHDPRGVSTFRTLIVPPKMYTFMRCQHDDPFSVFDYSTAAAAGRASPLLVPSPGRRRIFVSRKGNRRRRLANEDAIEALFGDFGFQIVESSRLTASERISLFANCDFVAGAWGSGLYQILFSRLEPRALVLVPPVDKFDKAFLTMGHVCNAKRGSVGYLFGRMVEDSRAQGGEFNYSWEVDLERLRRLLTEIT